MPFRGVGGGRPKWWAPNARSATPARPIPSIGRRLDSRSIEDLCSLPEDQSDWAELRSVHGATYDPRFAVDKLASNVNEAQAWDELWQQLHHRGGLGDSAYAAVPQLVQMHRKRGIADWNTYALVATIELARDLPGNPPIPHWIQRQYANAVREIADLGAHEITTVSDVITTRSILAILAIRNGARTYGRFLLEYGEDELREMEHSWNSQP